MEGLAKNIPILDLIRETSDLMVRLGYAESTMRHIRECWAILEKSAQNDGVSYLTHEFGWQVLEKRYGITPYNSSSTSFRSEMRRALMLLLEYQVSGQIAKRMPRAEHTFPAGFKDAGDAYLKHIQADKALSNGTLRNHSGTLERFFGYINCHGVGRLELVSAQHVNAYLKTLAGCAKSYISSKINVLRRFFAFARENGFTANEMIFPKISVFKDRQMPDYYTADETMRILKAIDRANPKGKRDYAMVLLGARYGLRVCDIKNLETKNLDFVNNTIIITQAKTGKPLTLDLLPDVGWAIIDYVKNGRPPSDCPKIFIRHVVPYETFGEYDSVAHIIGKYAQAAGIAGKPTGKNSFHMFRYGIASTLLQQGVSLTDISGILGHSELNVTTVYAKLDVPQLRVCALEVPR
jgi:site-specific recombinase XerD